MKIYHFLSARFWEQAPKIPFKSLFRFHKQGTTLFAKFLLGGLIYAILFCLNVYFFAFCSDNFNALESNVVNIICLLVLSIFGLISVAVWIIVPKRLALSFGFFSALLLFYWIGLSFRYSPFPYFAPFVSIIVALIYGVIIYFALFFANRFYRIFTLLALGFIYPFGFDWFIPQAFFAYSIFGVEIWQFILIECGIVLLLFSRKILKLFGVICLVCAIDFRGVLDSTLDSRSNSNLNSTKSSLASIKITQTSIPQDIKWQRAFLDSILAQVFSEIDLAITESKKIIIFPETILPFVLNESAPTQSKIYNHLLERSNHIAIIIGSLSKQNSQTFNSTYVLHNGQAKILNKVVLAPFGERIPLPEFLAKPLYKLFFGVDSGFESAKIPQDFELFNTHFRNAICYEGTSKIIHQNAPKFIVMISNNAWFYPSIEPFLQRILLKYYARIYHTTILHSANFSQSVVISFGLLSDLSPN